MKLYLDAGLYHPPFSIPAMLWVTNPNVYEEQASNNTMLALSLVSCCIVV